jgi:hypothetical protein
MQTSRFVLIPMGLVLFSSLAAADLLPPPGVRERGFADQIQRAGHPCATVSSLEEMTDDTAKKLAAQGLVAYAVVCNAGHKYLVANPPRRRGYQPNAPAPPASIVRVWNER